MLELDPMKRLGGYSSIFAPDTAAPSCARTNPERWSLTSSGPVIPQAAVPRKARPATHFFILPPIQRVTSYSLRQYAGLSPSAIYVELRRQSGVARQFLMSGPWRGASTLGP